MAEMIDMESKKICPGGPVSHIIVPFQIELVLKLYTSFVILQHIFI
jgi:hypothetical protein